MSAEGANIGVLGVFCGDDIEFLGLVAIKLKGGDKVDIGDKKNKGGDVGDDEDGFYYCGDGFDDVVELLKENKKAEDGGDNYSDYKNNGEITEWQDREKDKGAANHGSGEKKGNKKNEGSDKSRVSLFFLSFFGSFHVVYCSIF